MRSAADFVLVNTRQEDYREGLLQLPNALNPPLDVAYCAAVLERAGFSVRIVEANLLRWSHEASAAAAAESNPVGVVLNSNALDRWNCPLPTVEQPAALAAAVRARIPSATVVLMGPHGTSRPDWVMGKCPQVDVLVRGEPEETLLELCEALAVRSDLEAVLGISRRVGGQVVHNPDRPLLRDLDSLPWPAYHLLPMGEYGPLGSFTGGDADTQLSPAAVVLSSRGCPYRCGFCFLGMFVDHRNRYRSRRVEEVVEEVAYLVERFGVRAVYFHDLNFCVQRERVRAMCRLLVERKLGVGWGCETRFDNVDRELIGVMKEAGCLFINFGLESGAQEVLDASQKGVQLQEAARVVRLCREAGVRPGLFTLHALPGETAETLCRTVEFLVSNGIEPGLPLHLNLPVPYPGTGLHQQAEARFGRLEWDQVAGVAGRVGTELLAEVGSRGFQRQVRKSYFAARHGRYHLLKPAYYLDLYPRVENALRRHRVLSAVADLVKGSR